MEYLSNCLGVDGIVLLMRPDEPDVHDPVRIESKLADEEVKFSCGRQPIEASRPQSLRSYEKFIATIAKQFKENTQETRATLSKLLGGAVRLMAAQDVRQLVVSCALGMTTLPLPELVRT
jgi:hypothetical protein